MNTPHCDHLAHSGPGWTCCVRCGATCERDKLGVIVVYDRTPRLEPVEPQSESR